MLLPRVALLLDLRGVSYRHTGAKRDFADAFLGVHGTVTRRLWCLAGAGVSPINFDPWQSIFCDDAREDYLYARGVYRALAAGGEAASMKALLDAEDALANDWGVLFEAGFTF